MSKYRNLTAYLESIDAPGWTTSFSEIEKILGFPLPRSACTYNAWWSNQAGAGHSQSSAWQSIGWRTREVDLGGRTITFIRRRDKKTSEQNHRVAAHDQANQTVLSAPNGAKAENEKSKMVGLTMAEAKAGLAAHFGVPQESIEITIRG